MDITTIAKDKFEAVRFQKGDIINDKYEIIKQIGQGGHGIVYKVKKIIDGESSYTRALKVVIPNGTITLNRQKAEANVMANIDHPNIVKCYDYSLYRDHYPCMEVDYVNGFDLDQHLQSINLDIRVALSIVYLVADALETAHNIEYTFLGKPRIGAIHRDIKPGNILIENKGKVLLTDFGIAKIPEHTNNTMSSGAIGSIGYMSTEQIENREEVDGRTDIYALGCVLYRCITGKAAFHGASLPQSFKEKYGELYDKKVLKPFSKNVKKIIATCLKSDREKRYQTMTELKKVVSDELLVLGIGKPENCVSDFFRYQALPSLKPIKKESTFNVLVPASIVASAAIIAVVFLLRGSFERENATAETQIKAVSIKEKIVDRDVTKATSSPEKKISKKVSDLINLEPGEKSLKTAAIVPALKPVVTKKETRKVNSKISMINILKEFKNGNYQAVIKGYNNSSKRLISDEEYLAFLGASVQLHGTFKSQRTINDGYYYWLELTQIDENTYPEKYEKKFNQAMYTPSFYQAFKKEPLYQRINDLKNTYMKKPNVINREKLNANCELYLNLFCKSGNDQCDEVKLLFRNTDR